MNARRPDQADELESNWQTLVAEMENLASELSSEGWEPVVLRPGDISAVDDPDNFGLHVLIPDNEFEELETLVDQGATFDAFEIYKNAGDTYVYAIVVVRDAGTGSAVLYPIYYTATKREKMANRSKERGELRTCFRTLSDSRIVITHDPEAFFSQA